MSSKYYYLVAGLPELSLEDSKLSYTVADLKTEIYNGLSASDRKLIDLFYLKFDNANVLKLLKDKEAEIDKRGNYSAEELTEYISILREGGEISPKEFPVYLSTFITDYLNTPAESTTLHEDHLAALYYEYAMKCGNKFVSAWFEFNLNINNILVAFTSRKFKWDIASNVVGNTEVCEALRTSSARDFGLSGEVDVFESLVKISEITELVEREKKLDALGRSREGGVRAGRPRGGRGAAEPQGTRMGGRRGTKPRKERSAGNGRRPGRKGRGGTTRDADGGKARPAEKSRGAEERIAERRRESRGAWKVPDVPSCGDGFAGQGGEKQGSVRFGRGTSAGAGHGGRGTEKRRGAAERSGGENAAFSAESGPRGRSGEAPQGREGRLPAGHNGAPPSAKAVPGQNCSVMLHGCAIGKTTKENAKLRSLTSWRDAVSVRYEVPTNDTTQGADHVSV